MTHPDPQDHQVSGHSPLVGYVLGVIFKWQMLYLPKERLWIFSHVPLIAILASPKKKKKERNLLRMHKEVPIRVCWEEPRMLLLQWLMPPQILFFSFFFRLGCYSCRKGRLPNWSRHNIIATNLFCWREFIHLCIFLACLPSDCQAGSSEETNP